MHESILAFLDNEFIVSVKRGLIDENFLENETKIRFSNYVIVAHFSTMQEGKGIFTFSIYVNNNEKSKLLGVIADFQEENTDYSIDHLPTEDSSDELAKTLNKFLDCYKTLIKDDNI